MKRLLVWVVVLVIGLCAVGCDLESKSQPESTSGVSKANVQVKTGADGLTVEQRNIKSRYDLENKPGSIKHLYILSAYSGQTIIYSTVKGKVTSSGKRLSPYAVGCTDGQCVDSANTGIPVRIGNKVYRTPEVLQDDGTYGHSIPYLYWHDSKGVYHQHYLSGGQILHISNQPLAVSEVIINMEVSNGS